MRAARPCRAFTDLCPNLLHPRSDIGMTIGEGSFAHVKASRNIRTGTAVAIKVVDKMCRRFDPKLLRSEIDTMMHCDHPNCVTLFQVFDEPEKTYMVMELMTGGNVMDRIVELDHCSEELTCHVVTQTLSALRHLHGLGITHRDLKPENLLYASADPNSESYNTIKLADFGLARIMEDGCLKTMCGTPAYVAPEVLFQSVKKNGYHHEVDLWSLGVVVYVMLSGFLPFSHDSKPALFELIKNGDFDFPSPWWDEVSRDATDFVNGLLVVDPAERFTIDQCLRHEWLQSGGHHANRLHSSHHAFLLLRNLKIFENIEPSCLQDLVGKLRNIVIEAGEYIARAGEVGDSMYFIKKGSVQVLSNGSQIDKLFTGDFFGEIALTMSQTRIADLVSLGAGSAMEKRGPVELLQLARSDFEQLLIKYPVLESRFSCIGQSRVRRQARATLRQLEMMGHDTNQGWSRGTTDSGRLDVIERSLIKREPVDEARDSLARTERSTERRRKENGDGHDKGMPRDRRTQVAGLIQSSPEVGARRRVHAESSAAPISDFDTPETELSVDKRTGNTSAKRVTLDAATEGSGKQPPRRPAISRWWGNLSSQVLSFLGTSSQTSARSEYSDASSGSDCPEVMQTTAWYFGLSLVCGFLSFATLAMAFYMS